MSWTCIVNPSISSLPKPVRGMPSQNHQTNGTVESQAYVKWVVWTDCQTNKSSRARQVVRVGFNNIVRSIDEIRQIGLATNSLLVKFLICPNYVVLHVSITIPKFTINHSETAFCSDILWYQVTDMICGQCYTHFARLGVVNTKLYLIVSVSKT